MIPLILGIDWHVPILLEACGQIGCQKFQMRGVDTNTIRGMYTVGANTFRGERIRASDVITKFSMC